MKLSNLFLAAFLPSTALSSVIFGRDPDNVVSRTTKATNPCQKALLAFKGTFPSDFSYLSSIKVRDAEESPSTPFAKRADHEALMGKAPVSGTASDSLHTVGLGTCLGIGVTIPDAAHGKTDKLLAHVSPATVDAQKAQVKAIWTAVDAAWKAAKAAAPSKTIQPTYYLSLSDIASQIEDILASPDLASKTAEEKTQLKASLTKTQTDFETFFTNFVKYMNSKTGGAAATHVKTKRRNPGMGPLPDGTMKILANGNVQSEGVAWT